MRKVLLLGLIVVVAGSAWFLIRRQGKDAYREGAQPDITDGPCPGKTATLEMQDVYMRGLIEKGSDFTVVYNYYACHPVQRGDLVLYRLSKKIPPVVKIARAIPGDHFRVVRDPHQKAWNLEVNGKLVMSEGKPHFFGTSAPPTLALYEKPRNGVLGKNELIVLSSWAPGSSDSGIFGLVSQRDLIAKIESPRSERSTPSGVKSNE